MCAPLNRSECSASDSESQSERERERGSARVFARREREIGSGRCVCERQRLTSLRSFNGPKLSVRAPAAGEGSQPERGSEIKLGRARGGTLCLSVCGYSPSSEESCRRYYSPRYQVLARLRLISIYIYLYIYMCEGHENSLGHIHALERRSSSASLGLSACMCGLH